MLRAHTDVVCFLQDSDQLVVENGALRIQAFNQIAPAFLKGLGVGQRVLPESTGFEAKVELLHRSKLLHFDDIAVRRADLRPEGRLVCWSKHLCLGKLTGSNLGRPSNLQTTRSAKCCTQITSLLSSLEVVLGKNSLKMPDFSQKLFNHKGTQPLLADQPVFDLLPLLELLQVD